MLVADGVDDTKFCVLNSIDNGMLQASSGGSVKRDAEDWGNGTCLLGAKSVLSSCPRKPAIATDFECRLKQPNAGEFAMGAGQTVAES